jgi:hypothetical protein
LLTAWSTAGILGPVIVNYMHDVRQEAKVPFDQIYAPIFLVLAGLLVVGFIANWLVKPVSDQYFMSDAELAEERKMSHEKQLSAASSGSNAIEVKPQASIVVVLAWFAVLIPISYGVWKTLEKAWGLFT